MSEQIINIDWLLAPISEENPSGEELQVMEASFSAVKEAYGEARALVKEQQDKILSGGKDSQDKPWRVIPPPDWTKVIELASSTLSGVSKDFRIAGWLAEALLRRHGLEGLDKGLELCKGICERYWDTIHPTPTQEDGHGVTISAFASLVSDSTSPAILAAVIVEGTRPNERTQRRYSAFDYLRAKDPKMFVELEKEVVVSMPEFMSIAELTPVEFHATNLALIKSCIANLDWLDDFLRAQCLPDEYDEATSPVVSGVKTTLEQLKRIIVEIGGEAVVAAVDPVATSGDGPSGQSLSGSGTQMTRESAFRTIEEIARFFERTEPHTPVHFALRKVVRWGRMPLPQLLAELIEDGGAMESLRKLIGLPEENPNDN